MELSYKLRTIAKITYCDRVAEGVKPYSREDRISIKISPQLLFLCDTVPINFTRHQHNQR